MKILSYKTQLLLHTLLTMQVSLQYSTYGISDFPKIIFSASLMNFILLIVWLYISAILGGCFINGSIPLFYELTIETTYPIAEGIPMAVVTTSNHLACLLFLAALMIPGIGENLILSSN